MSEIVKRVFNRAGSGTLADPFRPSITLRDSESFTVKHEIGGKFYCDVETDKATRYNFNKRWTMDSAIEDVVGVRRVE
jgi:hypothetical protein